MITRSEARVLLKDWKTIIKPVKEYMRQTGNTIVIVKEEEKCSAK